ncbi:MAG: cyclic nucleotide-binding domain-containing protein [Myxococcaceae bacterium]|jgi:CRP-like cAMP-binding protein|nr:cyclic nucleotide-binding domain-containing protein [Myxococcaceae bacterium]MCA3015011.1 cyclic nucleotide-binding domain-containing protein [Myxococcaceae bacterium]
MSIPAALLKKLVQIPIFQGLTVPEAAEFFEVALEQTVEPGRALFREGDEGDALFVILSGTVAVTKRDVELATLSTHAVLGEMSLVSPGDARSATAVAKTEVTVLKVPSKRVQKLIKGEHLAALKVVVNLAQVMAQRLAAINERLVGADLRTRGGDSKRAELADFAGILNRWSF